MSDQKRVVQLTVEGKVEGQMRPRTAKSGHVYSPRCKWRELVAKAWKDSGAESYGKSPMYVEVHTHRRKPKRSNCEPESDIYKPDIDNILKACLDGLVDAGAFDDDCQVMAAMIVKHSRVKMDENEQEWSQITIANL